MTSARLSRRAPTRSTRVEDSELAGDLEEAASVNLKRLLRPGNGDWHAHPGLSRILTFPETKTVGHPTGI